MRLSSTQQHNNSNNNKQTQTFPYIFKFARSNALYLKLSSSFICTTNILITRLLLLIRFLREIEVKKERKSKEVIKPQQQENAFQRHT